MIPAIHPLTLLLLAAVTASAGEGIGIGPALVLIDDVRPGAVIDLGAKGLRWLAQNQGAAEQVFAIEVVAPPAYSLKAFEAGYEPLPDASWLALERTSLTVPPRSTADTGATLRIPDAPEHWNRHYVVYVELGAGERVALGATLRVRARLLIETAVRAQDAAPAASLIAITPGRVDLERAGDDWQGGATVRNQGPAATFDVLTLDACHPGLLVDRHPRYFPGQVQAMEHDDRVRVDVASFDLPTGGSRALRITSTGVQPAGKAIDAVRFIARRASADATDVREARGQRYDRIELLRLRHASVKAP